MNILRLTDKVLNIPTFNWVSLGPTSGAYFNYGNISSRIVSGAFDPTNPNIIYIGPANGGVWKSTDAGIILVPINRSSKFHLSMGAIEIDPQIQILFMPEQVKQLIVVHLITAEDYLNQQTVEQLGQIIHQVYHPQLTFPD